MSKKSRIGVGMKPRISRSESTPVVEEVSATAGQQESVTEAVLGQEEVVSTGDTLAPEKFQNLDSGNDSENDVSVASAEVSGLENLLKLSAVGPVTIGLPEPLTPESTLGDEPVTVSAPATMFIRVNHGPKPKPDMTTRLSPSDVGLTGAGTYNHGTKPTIAELEELMDRSGGKVEIHPDGSVTAYPIGERSDGSYGLVVTIPEGMLEPIRQQAESDRITPEEWVSTRLLEYLESWWAAPASR